MARKPAADAEAENGMCFVVMPIGDSEGYVKGHFKHVYEDIVQPACEQAGFSPMRADQVKQSNLIHLDILQKLIEAPMAICDLSSRNPNVLFELALRQAFDKPVALIQEVGTPQIFDISPLRYTEYRKERIYHEVLDDQKAIAEAVAETFKSHGTGRSINSIVKLLALSKPASIPDIGSPEAKEDLQQVILAELSQLRDEVRSVRDARVAATRLEHRRDASLELDRLQEAVHEVQMRLTSAGDEAPERTAMLLNECEHRLASLIIAGPTILSPRELAAARDLEGRIDALASMLQAQRRPARSKKKP